MSPLPPRESLTVEFKSDRRSLPDRDLVAAVVSLANSEGGDLYLGVEDDGRPTGVQPAHADADGLRALIANRTTPPLRVTAARIDQGSLVVVHIAVPKSPDLIATSEGLLQRRRIRPDGTPESVPFYPHEFAQRQAALARLDVSAQPVAGATLADLDSLERTRLRRMIERFHGDAALLALPDEELDAALGLTRRQPEGAVPTLAGLLLIGCEPSLRRLVPTHEVAFQVLQGTAVKVNEFFRQPLLAVFEAVEQRFLARVEEEELDIGLFRVPAPNYDRTAFREALVNAMTHRDYARLGAIHVRIEDERLTISNPGGFVEGVTLGNLLVVEPRPRNPLLADIIKRVGLAERTGRGVDRIFEGLLRAGHPAPDYGRSDTAGVAVDFSGGKADLDFLRVIVEHENRTSTSLSLDALLVLRKLRDGRRLPLHDLAAAAQRDEARTRSVVEGLVEAGLVSAHGATKGRTYTLSPALYRREGRAAEFVRQVGFDRIQQEQMVLKYVETHGSIQRAEAADLCHIGLPQAYRLLSRLRHEGRLEAVHGGRNTAYRTPGNAQGT